jgi:hypothetical protein
VSRGCGRPTDASGSSTARGVHGPRRRVTGELRSRREWSPRSVARLLHETMDRREALSRGARERPGLDEDEFCQARGLMRMHRAG